MYYWVLNKQRNVISQSTVQHVTNEDILNPILRETLELADKNIKEKLADEKHELELCPEKSSFTKILSWMRKKNDNSTLKFLKLKITQKKDLTVLLVQTVH